MSEPERPTDDTTTDRTGPLSRGSAGPDAAGRTSARDDDGVHPTEGAADAAGPAVDAGDRPAVPTTVATAPSIRGASSSAQAADTGAAQGGTAGERDDLRRPG
ncbi:hypothetical protein [Pseudonocardia humida]|uniref:Uncharacterized protein n=1 Tax=Pseudonocardia humida TaxID=2800819 RepID=A0ABT1A014_9PSEU|nr:hypothetical protein [Pseudonocardia humida]MCO1656149.1 hypothetical protein [Pseudonocardia humida]